MKRIRLYEPTFRGLHNHSRCLAWLTLYDCYIHRKRGLSLQELVSRTGLPYGSLASQLSRWVRWRYIGYRTTPKGRRYRLRKRAVRWLIRWQDVMPIQQYINELEDVQRG